MMLRRTLEKEKQRGKIKSKRELTEAEDKITAKVKSGFSTLFEILRLKRSKTTNKAWPQRWTQRF